MLHILLTILKIIGIILLAILGIVILLLCVVFFVPLRYEIQAETKGDLKTTKLQVCFSWLLHLIDGNVSYIDEKLDYKIRIAWKKISQKEDSAEEEVVDETESKAEIETEAGTETKTEIEESMEKQAEKPAEPAREEEAFVEETGHTEDSKFEKIKCTIIKVCDKIKMVLDFLKEEPHKLTLQRIKKEVIRLLVPLKPKKLKGNVRFGMEDPYVTGQILAVLSVIYPIYADNVEIYPEFDKKVLEGDIYLKGHIRVFYAVRMAFGLSLDKNVRITIKDVMALFNNN